MSSPFHPLGMIDDLAAIAKCGPESVILNSIINAKINLKQLEFNQSKCLKLHISKEDKKMCRKAGEEEPLARNVQCVFLEVQECEMKSADNEKYIGDFISSNGSNDANISRRRCLGMGSISQIFTILNEVSIGYQYVEIGLILRESILLSKMLLSSESWHKLHQYQIEKLDEVDRMFYKKLFNSHSKTGTEFYYSETGTIPLKFRLSERRLLYWKHILTVERSEMIYRVFKAQKLSPVVGDWIHLLEKDKKMYGLEVDDETIAALSKQKFKNLVKKRSKELTIEYLNTQKRKHKKSEQLEVGDLSISPYLSDTRFSKNERELLFKLRSKTIQVKDNFKNAYQNNDLLCDLCKLFPCTQSHPMQCPQLNLSLVVDKTLHMDEKLIYGSADEQLLYIKIFTQFWELRERLLNNK